MNRVGAFLIHLGISLVIFAVLAALVLYVWYPDFFFASDGGWQGIRIIVLVDLVLGPLLTLVVFNRNKPRKELTRDLSMIATFQAVCLVAGVYVVYTERPLALVYVDGQFFSMSADDYRSAGVEVPDFSGLPGSYPKQVAVVLPEDLAEQGKVRGEALRSRTPLRALAEYYEPLSFEMLNADKEAIAIEELKQRNQGAAKLEAWSKQHAGQPADYAFFPFGARYEYFFLGVSKETGEIAGLLDVPRIEGLPSSADA